MAEEGAIVHEDRTTEALEGLTKWLQHYVAEQNRLAAQRSCGGRARPRPAQKPSSGFRKLKFHLWNPLATVGDVVQEWTPRRCNTEKDYERSLYIVLHEALG